MRELFTSPRWTSSPVVCWEGVLGESDACLVVGRFSLSGRARSASKACASVSAFCCGCRTMFSRRRRMRHRSGRPAAIPTCNPCAGRETEIEGRLFRLGELEELQLVIATMHLQYARRQIGDASADRRIVAQIGQDNELLALAETLEKGNDLRFVAFRTHFAMRTSERQRLFHSMAWAINEAK